MLKLDINLAIKIFAIGVALPILSGIATRVYWYLQMRTGVEGPYFLYYCGSLRTSFLIYLISPIFFVLLILALRHFAVINRCSAIKIRYSSLCIGPIVLVAFVLRIITVFNADYRPPQATDFSDQACYYLSALGIMNGEYPMFFLNRGHIGLLWAPLIIFFENSVLAIMLLNVVTATLTVYLVYRIITMVSGRFCLGLIAAGILAVFPSHVTFCRELMTETTFTFFMIFALFWLVRFGVMSSLPQYWISRRWILDIFLCGINLGICHWIRPLAVLVWLVAIVWLLIIVNRKAGLSLHRSLVAIVVLSVIFYSSISWLMVANYRLQGEFSPSYMEGRGFIFLAGTVGQARGADHNGYSRFQDLGKIVNDELSKEHDLQKWGHKEVQGLLKRAAWRRILDSPVEFLSMAATEKMCKLWTQPNIGDQPGKILNSIFSPGDNLNSLLISFAMLSALSLFFVCGVVDRRVMMLLLLASIIVTACSACHFMLSSWGRYRFHCVPWLIIFITLSMHTLFYTFTNRTRQGTNQ